MDATMEELTAEINELSAKCRRLESMIDVYQSEVIPEYRKRAVEAEERAKSAEKIQRIVELLQDAASETEHGEKLSVGFVAAAKQALAEWNS